MKLNNLLLNSILGLCLSSVFLVGCASTGDSAASSSGGTKFPKRYKAADGRTVDIGKSDSANGGLMFKEPHMEKCWLADDFKFTGYDTLYIVPTLSIAKFHDDEQRPHDIAKEKLPLELRSSIQSKALFENIALQESEIKPGAKVLRLENTITEYSKGGGAARYFAGLYGAGQPMLKVQGKMTAGDKTLFNFEA